LLDYLDELLVLLYHKCLGVRTAIFALALMLFYGQKLHFSPWKK
jgi:hypothetical protein